MTCLTERSLRHSDRITLEKSPDVHVARRPRRYYRTWSHSWESSEHGCRYRNLDQCSRTRDKNNLLYCYVDCQRNWKHTGNNYDLQNLRRRIGHTQIMSARNKNRKHGIRFTHKLGITEATSMMGKFYFHKQQLSEIISINQWKRCISHSKVKKQYVVINDYMGRTYHAIGASRSGREPHSS